MRIQHEETGRETELPEGSAVPRGWFRLLDCSRCNNTGLIDSGGAHPWGEYVQIPCPQCAEKKYCYYCRGLLPHHADDCPKQFPKPLTIQGASVIKEYPEGVDVLGIKAYKGDLIIATSGGVEKVPICADCGSVDYESMRTCQAHKTQFCRGCVCPDCEADK